MLRVPKNLTKLNSQREYPELYLEFLLEFHTTRNYFTCHDLLEDLWRETSLTLEKDNVYVGLLQIAVAMYHWRRKNFRGASILIAGSITKLTSKEIELEALGIQFLACLKLLEQLQIMIAAESTYCSPNIPLQAELARYYVACCQQRQLVWQAESCVANELLVNAHLYK